MASVFRFQELTTGRVVEDLPMRCDSLPRVMSGSADTQMTLNLADKRVKALAYREATTPGRMGVFAIENDQPVWGGMVWSRTYDRTSRRLTLNCSSIESYWASRFITNYLNFQAVDQFSIFVQLINGTAGLRSWNVLQPPTYASSTNVPSIQNMWIYDYNGNPLLVADCLASVILPYHQVITPGGTAAWVIDVSSGIQRDRQYSPGKNILEAMQELSAVGNGFEWTLDPVILGSEAGDLEGGLGWKLRIATPRLGRTYDQTGFFWAGSRTYDGISALKDEPDDNIITYQFTEDTRQSANHQIDTGAEVNGSVIVADLADLRSILAGYPVLEQSKAYPDVISGTTLVGHAAGDLGQAMLPQRFTEWTVDPTHEPQFTEYTLGDEALFAVSDDLDPVQESGDPGRSSIERIVGWDYRPSSSEQSRLLKLITNPTVQPTAKLPPAIQRRLQVIERQLGAGQTTARTPTNNITVSPTTPYVNVPAGTTSTYGADTIITNLVFVKQSDFLHVFVQLTAGVGNATITSYYDVRSNIALVGYTSGVYNAGKAIYDDKISLADWSYGDIVEIEVHEQQIPGPATAARPIRVYSAWQGPK